MIETEEFYCRKHTFPKRGKAAKALARLRSKGVDMRQVYKCQHCKQWHLSSQPPRS